jgi:hypothetical protein
MDLFQGRRESTAQIWQGGNAGKNNIFGKVFRAGRPVWLMVVLVFGGSFFPADRPAAVHSNCAGVHNFYGYSFLDPEIVHKNAAYAPFFLKWDDYYDQVYFNRDVQKDENLREWSERFCAQPDQTDVEYVVYKASSLELSGLRNAAIDAQQKTPLPYLLAGNSFAYMIAVNGCTEVVDYLLFAKKCEPYVVAQGGGWQLPETDEGSMQLLIREGVDRFNQTESHFIRLRYAYQIVRLAHYARQWQQTVDLYNKLMPQVDRRKPSIVFFWTMGHLAGALRQLGKYPEAAYRYSLIFRHCPSKRAQAYRSFLIRNDQDWDATLKLCQNDSERSTLFILRAGGAHTYTVKDMAVIYDLDPTNPQLELLLVSEVQQLEKVFLRTRVTDQRYGLAKGLIKRENGSAHLLDLQKFVRKVLNDGQTPNQKLWRSISGYLELLAGDSYAAEQSFDRAESMLNKKETYDKGLLKQLETWRVLLTIMKMDPSTPIPDAEAYKARSLAAFKNNRNFEPFLEDWLSAAYANTNHPGKALLAAYDPAALGYNPNMEALDDLLKQTEEGNSVFLEHAMMIDTNPERLRTRLLEIKGMSLLVAGQPEAALTVLRSIKPTELASAQRFSPFREKFGEKIHREVGDSLLLNRKEIVEKILDFDFQAKAASAMHNADAARLYYMNGLCYYNMSYFGYEWEVMDFFRSGYNWNRLPQGPVFPMNGSPNGNRENTDVSMALGYFEQALREAQNPELAARAAFMAARCQQKQWFCTPDCTYRPGSKLIPTLPPLYRTYYNILKEKYSNTEFYGVMVKECKWLGAYMR